MFVQQEFSRFISKENKTGCRKHPMRKLKINTLRSEG